MDSIAENWVNHVLMDEFPFPRDVAMPYRVKARTRKEYLRILNENLTRRNLYVAIFSDWQIGTNTFNKVFLDLDDEGNLERAYKDVIKLAKHIKEKYGETPRVYFSGRKGFHVYLDFEPATFKHYQQAVREYVYELIMKINLRTLDTQVIGDVRRVSRIPYTVNIISQRLCIPIDVNWTLSEILWQSRSCDLKVSVERRVIPELAKELKELDKGCNQFIRSPVAREVLTKELNTDKYVEELNLLMEVAKHGLSDFRHRLIHFAIVPRLVLLGKTDEEILNFCREFILLSSPVGRKRLDVYERYILRSIKRTREGKWMPWDLETLIYYFPGIEKQFERVKQDARIGN